MIIVHDIFICKPGNASKMAKMFKEMQAATGMNGVPVRRLVVPLPSAGNVVLRTDATGVRL